MEVPVMETVNKCPLCGEVNPPDDWVCEDCSEALGAEERNRLETAIKAYDAATIAAYNLLRDCMTAHAAEFDAVGQAAIEILRAETALKQSGQRSYYQPGTLERERPHGHDVRWLITALRDCLGEKQCPTVTIPLDTGPHTLEGRARTAECDEGVPLSGTRPHE
jgi:predicted nucleic acid-binding Zn ribbon protein